jgi:hypothetical protein
METKVDYQEASAYAEVRISSNFSTFFEVPVRFINPEMNDNHTGLSDINFGFKYALINCADEVFTFQLRTYTPTGNSHEGLGTNNWNVEPALLLYKRLSDRLFFEGELRDWIPLTEDEFAGNVIRYGAGLNYLVYNTCRFRINPVVEVVGWTVLGGKELAGDSGEILDAAGDTIVNAKLGVRFGFGQLDDPHGVLSRADLYVGYGRALTGEVWYKDIYRAEFRLHF